MANIHSLNIGGSTYVIEPKTVKVNDVRGADRPTSYFADCALTPWFNQNTRFNGNHWASGITMKGWTNDYQSWQLASGSTSSLQPELKFRNGINDAWQPWRKIILEGDAATSSYSIYVTYNPTSNNTYSVPFMDYGHSKHSKIYSDNTFNYNPYTNTLTARNFAGTATNSDQVAIHTKEFIQDSGLCSLDAIYEVPVILGGCDCTIFSDQPDVDYFGLMTDYHPQNNNSNWLRYNFNDQTLKSTNFEGNFIGNATTATNAENSEKVLIYSENEIRNSGICQFENVNVPILMGGCGCSTFINRDQAGEPQYYNVMTNVEPGGFENGLFYNLTTKKIVSDLAGNADTATNATNATNAKVNVTSTSGNYPLILGPSTIAGGTVSMGNKSLYTDRANNLYYNPSTNTLTATNFAGNLNGTATNATYINVASSSTNNGTYMLTFVNGTDNRKAYTNSGVCVNPSTKTIIADQIRGFGNGSWNQDYAKATSYNGSISSGSSWAPVCAVRTTGGVWSMGHIWPGGPENYLTFSYVGDSVRETNGNVTLKLPVPKYNRMNFIPIGDQQFDGQPAVARIVTLSSSQYTNLTSKDPNTLYLII